MVRRFAFVVTLVAVCVVGALGLAAPLRLSPMRTSTSLLKMSSVATPPPSPVSVLQRITNAASYLARNPLRLQYATAMSARFGWFLNQGIALSVAGIDKSSAADEERMRANRQGLSVPSVLGALVDAVVNDEDFALPSGGVDALTGTHVSSVFFFSDNRRLMTHLFGIAWPRQATRRSATTPNANCSARTLPRSSPCCGGT